MPSVDDARARLIASARRLPDPRSVEHGVVTSVLTGALALVDPNRLSPGARFAHRLANAGLGAAIVWASLRDEALLRENPIARGGVAVGAGGLGLGMAELTERGDARMQERLQRMGVPGPRVAMALGAAAATAVGWWLSKRGAERAELEELEAMLEAEADALLAPETVDVPQPVRALAEALLSRSEDFGSFELRAQLNVARAVEYEGAGGPGAFYPGIGFTVPEGVPLAVPAQANFPVTGRFRALGGLEFEVYLSIVDGRIANLSVSETSDWTEEQQRSWFEAGRGVHELPGWPAPEELDFVIETRDGLAPLA